MSDKNKCPECGTLRKLLAAGIAENDRLHIENAALHLALFHVENGLSHPDPAIRKLIEAAMAALDERPAG